MYIGSHFKYVLYGRVAWCYNVQKSVKLYEKTCPFTSIEDTRTKKFRVSICKAFNGAFFTVD